MMDVWLGAMGVNNVNIKESERNSEVTTSIYTIPMFSPIPPLRSGTSKRCHGTRRGGWEGIVFGRCNINCRDRVNADNCRDRRSI